MKSPKASIQSTISEEWMMAPNPRIGHVESVEVEGMERRSWTHWGGDRRGQVRDVADMKSLR